MPKSSHDYLEFATIDEFVDLLRTRQNNLAQFKKETPTDWQRKACTERSDEVDHFIDLIVHSNLTVGIGINNRYLLKSKPTTSKKKYKLKKLAEPKEGSKKLQILNYIRERNDKVTGAEVAAGTGFDINSVSAHMSALKSAGLLENAEGLWWAATKQV